MISKATTATAGRRGHGRHLDEHRRNDLDRVKAQPGRHVVIEIGVVHAMEAPEDGDAVEGDVLRPDDASSATKQTGPARQPGNGRAAPRAPAKTQQPRCAADQATPATATGKSTDAEQVSSATTPRLDGHAVREARARRGAGARFPQGHESKNAEKASTGGCEAPGPDSTLPRVFPSPRLPQPGAVTPSEPPPCPHPPPRQNENTGRMQEAHAAVTLIDNYDSFTFNLVPLSGLSSARMSRVPERCAQRRPTSCDAADAIVLSPGPCTPNEAGICLDLIDAAGAAHPDVRRLPRPPGDRRRPSAATSSARHADARQGRDHPASRARASSAASTGRSRRRAIIRSWSRDDLPADLEVTAETEDGLIMGLSHRTCRSHGVQFHPESIASEHGQRIISRTSSTWRASGTRARARAPPGSTDDIDGDRMEAFKPLIAKVATGGTPRRAEAREAFDAHAVGRSRRPRRSAAS